MWAPCNSFYCLSNCFFKLNQKAQILYIGCVFVADEDADVSETEPDKGKQADIPASFSLRFLFS
jgi:hypothetical protein